MVLAFLIIIPLIVVTGIANAQDEGFGLVSPLARIVPTGLGDFHEALVWLLYAMILGHVAAVFVDWWLTGDNLVAAMVTGRKSGTIEGYSYTEANKNSGITWNKDVFLEYIKDPKAKIPGTKMIYAGLKDEQRIKDLTAYLKQFDAAGKKTAAAQ